MPFKIIQGTFHVVGYSPDGDSIRFLADDLELMRSLEGPRPVKLNARNHAQLRIEAIDALETHYSTAGGTYHQPLEPAFDAAEALLSFLGITDVQWDAGHRTVIAANDGVRGYVLSRAVEKFGRPIAFVYAGDPPQADGTDIFLDTDLLARSFNQLALAEGHAYPTFYSGLFHDLRDALTAATAAARAAGNGVHAIDATNSGVSGETLGPITEEVAIMPKLFRRLVEYIVANGSSIGFKQAMELSGEPVLDLTNANFTHLDTFIEQAEGSYDVALSRKPEELVFDPMPDAPLNAFALVVGNADEPQFA